LPLFIDVVGKEANGALAYTGGPDFPRRDWLKIVEELITVGKGHARPSTLHIVQEGYIGSATGSHQPALINREHADYWITSDCLDGVRQRYQLPLAAGVMQHHSRGGVLGPSAWTRVVADRPALIRRNH